MAGWGADDAYSSSGAVRTGRVPDDGFNGVSYGPGVLSVAGPQGGVGLVFRKDEEGSSFLLIDRVVPGGPGARAGMIQVRRGARCSTCLANILTCAHILMNGGFCRRATGW